MSDRLGQVLAFIGDKPWKAVAVMLAMLLGGAGWALYEKRDVLFEAWLTPSAATLKTGEIPEALDKLVQESGADLVQVWQADLSSNSQWFIGARDKSGERPAIPSPRRLPIIVTVSDATTLVNVLAGNPVCVDIRAEGSPLARRLTARGMARGCAIPIPPDPSAFVGVIYLAWRERPDASIEEVAAGAAREIAATLATR